MCENKKGVNSLPKVGETSAASQGVPVNPAWRGRLGTKKAGTVAGVRCSREELRQPLMPAESMIASVTLRWKIR